MWEYACLLACAHTPLPTGLCDHIPADMPFRSLVTSAGVSKWQGLFVCVLICSEETGTDSWRRQEEGSHNKFPPARHKMSSFPWLRRAPSHPAEKSRHLKLCDMCHRHCHWASATDGAGIDRPRATGAGWGTHRVWCVSLPILVRDASRAATPTQTALWDGRGVPERGWHMLDMRLCACEGMNGMPGITYSRLIKVWSTDLPVGNALLDPSAPSLLLLLLGNFLAEQMAHHFISADQWHSAIEALQASLLATMCVSVCVHSKRRYNSVPTYFQGE